MVQEILFFMEIALVSQCELICLISGQNNMKGKKSYPWWTCADVSKKEKSQNNGVKGWNPVVDNDLS